MRRIGVTLCKLVKRVIRIKLLKWVIRVKLAKLVIRIKLLKRATRVKLTNQVIRIKLIKQATRVKLTKQVIRIELLKLVIRVKLTKQVIRIKLLVMFSRNNLAIANCQRLSRVHRLLRQVRGIQRLLRNWRRAATVGISGALCRHSRMRCLCRFARNSMRPTKMATVG
jgi:hypothetical protein